MKTRLHKILIAATVLTALSASAAFAADTAASQSMAERSAAILHCGNNPDCPQYGHHRDCPGDHPQYRHHHRRHHGPRLTDEQIKERQERYEQWQKMTPEERQEAREQWRAQRDAQRAEAMKKLTPEQRQEVEEFINAEKKHREQTRTAYQKMTKEQREAIRGHREHRAPHHYPHQRPTECPA